MSATLERRKTKLTPQLERVVLAAFKATPNVTLACEHAGIPRRTYHHWIAEGERELEALAIEHDVQLEELTLDDVSFDSHPFAHLALSVRKAKADYLLERLARIAQAGAGVPEKTTKTTTKTLKDGTTLTETTVVERTVRHWTADAWLAERQFPELRVNHRVEISGPDGEAVPIELRAASVMSKLEAFKASAIDVTEAEEAS